MSERLLTEAEAAMLSTGPLAPRVKPVAFWPVEPGRFEAYSETITPFPGAIPMKSMGYRWVPTPRTDHGGACREAFRRVRRDVWSARESRLVAKWEGYG